MKQSSKQGILKVTRPVVAIKAGEIKATVEDTSTWLDDNTGNKVDSGRLALSTTSSTTITGCDTVYSELWDRAPSAWKSGSDLIIPPMAPAMTRTPLTLGTDITISIASDAPANWSLNIANTQAYRIGARLVLEGAADFVDDLGNYNTSSTTGIKFQMDKAFLSSGSIDVGLYNSPAQSTSPSINGDQPGFIWTGHQAGSGTYITQVSRISAYQGGGLSRIDINYDDLNGLQRLNWSGAEFIIQDWLAEEDQKTSYITLYDNIASGVLGIPEATLLRAGAITTGTQSIAGDKHLEGDFGVGIVPFQLGVGIADTGGGQARLYRDSNTIISGEELGTLHFQATQGGGLVGAAIRGEAGGTWVNGSAAPGRLKFRTGHDASASVQDRMIIDEDGFVGINTTTPTNLLSIIENSSKSGFHIGPAANEGGYIGAAGNGQLNLGAGLEYTGVNWMARDTDVGLINLNNGEFRFYNKTGATPGQTTPIDELFTIRSNGRVGIGATNPTAKFEVRDNGTIYNPIVLIQADDATPWALNIGNQTFSSSDTQGLKFHVHDDGRSFIYAADNGVTTGTLVFGTGNEDRVVIDDIGRVGINVAAPIAQLDVALGAVASATQDPAGTAQVHIRSATGGSRGLTIETDATSAANTPFFSFVDGDSNAYRMRMTDGDLYFGSGFFQTRAVFAANGNLGINTTDVEESRVTIGANAITGNPQINILGTDSHLSTPDGNRFEIGHWNSLTDTFTERFRITSVGDIYMGSTSGIGRLVVEKDDTTTLATFQGDPDVLNLTGIIVGNTAAHSASQEAFFQLNSMTDVQSRAAFRIAAGFDNTADASRNTAGSILTVESGTFEDAITFSGKDFNFLGELSATGTVTANKVIGTSFETVSTVTVLNDTTPTVIATGSGDNLAGTYILTVSRGGTGGSYSASSIAVVHVTSGTSLLRGYIFQDSEVTISATGGSVSAQTVASYDGQSFKATFVPLMRFE